MLLMEAPFALYEIKTSLMPIMHFETRLSDKFGLVLSDHNALINNLKILMSVGIKMYEFLSILIPLLIIVVEFHGKACKIQWTFTS